MPGFKPRLRTFANETLWLLEAEFDAEKKDVDTYDLDRKYWQQFCTSRQTDGIARNDRMKSTNGWLR